MNDTKNTGFVSNEITAQSLSNNNSCLDVVRHDPNVFCVKTPKFLQVKIPRQIGGPPIMCIVNLIAIHLSAKSDQ